MFRKSDMITQCLFPGRCIVYSVVAENTSTLYRWSISQSYWQVMLHFRPTRTIYIYFVFPHLVAAQKCHCQHTYRKPFSFRFFFHLISLFCTAIVPSISLRNRASPHSLHCLSRQFMRGTPSLLQIVSLIIAGRDAIGSRSREYRTFI